VLSLLALLVQILTQKGLQEDACDDNSIKLEERLGVVRMQADKDNAIDEVTHARTHTHTHTHHTTHARARTHTHTHTHVTCVYVCVCVCVCVYVQEYRKNNNTCWRWVTLRMLASFDINLFESATVEKKWLEGVYA
jgi:hypothetical protein